MKIIITDGHTLNPGDLTWNDFRQLGELLYYDRTAARLTKERCSEANVIITNKTPITEEIIATATQLKVIAVTATGYNVVDIQAAKKKGIPVCNVPIYGTDSVAQHAFALLLEITNRVGRHAQSVHEGEWSRSVDWCYSKTPIIELRDKVFGIVGFGRIGQHAATIARAFGMKVVFVDPGNKSEWARSSTLREVFSQSDFISIHCPLTKDNQGFINKELLAVMKKNAFLINTSRGQLINESDLAESLQEGVLAGAALDVLSEEPPPANHPLIGLTNCIITPHIAWLSFEARQRIMQTTFTNVKQTLAGNPQNVVNF